MTSGVVIQARSGSTRFPNKVLAMIQGKSVLQHVVERAWRVGADHVIVALPEGRDDDLLEYHVDQQLQCSYYRGHPTDVLARYYGAAAAFHLDAVVRLTADCPLLDPSLVQQVLAKVMARKASYASNVYPTRTYPDGLDCEAFTTDLLDEAAFSTKEQYDREHVTPWMQRTAWERGKVASVEHDHDLSHLRWTLDTVGDLATIRSIYGRLPEDPTFAWEETLKAAQQAAMGDA